jgi:hypothetical protein
VTVLKIECHCWNRYVGGDYRMAGIVLSRRATRRESVVEQWKDSNNEREIGPEEVSMYEIANWVW